MIDKFKPHWEEKNWGRVFHAFAGPEASVSYLDKLVEGEQCSIHYHKTRANVFVVTSGLIVVEQSESPGFIEHGFMEIHGITKLLAAGDSYCVSAFEWHRFSVMRPNSSLIEIYHPEGGPVDENDIERWNKGGSFDMNTMKEKLVVRSLL